jgi:uncharacterized metal-binding protein
MKAWFEMLGTAYCLFFNEHCQNLFALLSPESHFTRYSFACVLCGTGGGSLSMAKPPKKEGWQ